MAGAKRDCFAWRGKGKCTALRYTYCEIEECKFYKKGSRCVGCLNPKLGLSCDMCANANLQK